MLTAFEEHGAVEEHWAITLFSLTNELLEASRTADELLETVLESGAARRIEIDAPQHFRAHPRADAEEVAATRAVLDRHGATPTLLGAYKGPGSVKKTTALAVKGYESQYYAFPHKSAPLASQALNVDGHRGWLIASYLTYKRAGVRATGEIVATAVIDTGRKAPAAVFASLPNTNRKAWPDLNEFLGQLKVAA